MAVRPLLLAAFALLGLAPAAHAARFERIGRFSEPVYVTGLPGRLVVVERYGRIFTQRHGRRRLLADLRRRVLVRDPDETVDQRGLFSVAFPPDYRRSRVFYVQYVDRTGRERVDRLGRGGRRLVLDLGPATTQHHGGQLQFGPDGLLYVSTGMGADPATSQDPASLGGKILRLDPRAGAPPEVYALGLRNPWRFSFDRGTMLIGDVGDERTEEIDVIAAGAPPGSNFGWPAYEGRRRLPAAPDVAGALAPALSYSHRRNNCAVTGGYVVRDRRVRSLYGRYVYGDLCTGRIWSARLSERSGEATAGGEASGRDRKGSARGSGRLGRPRRIRLEVPYLVSFGEDAAGRIYAVSFLGDVYRLRR